MDGANGMPGAFCAPQAYFRQWGDVIGRCAGTATELAMVKKRINKNPECNDPRQWQ